MTKNQFREWALKEVRILDGATGTMLQKAGMPSGVCPEKWVLENPDTLLAIQREYLQNGSDIIYAFTFGANGLKLKEYDVSDVEGYNRELAKLSKKAAGDRAYVAGDLAPTGQMMEPFGIYTFEDIVEAYKKQVRGLLDGGVDLFAIETMMDIQEARAAVLAVREMCDLPVIATMTFNTDGHTINGTDPITALVTLQALGVDAFGCNCSTGPGEMIELIRRIKPYSEVPLVAKPNAGLPDLVDGKTVFQMDADEFAGYTADFIKSGVNLIGGCCGTSPEFIKKVYEASRGLSCENISPKADKMVTTSSRRYVTLYDGMLSRAAGNRIDTGMNKELMDDLLDGSMELVTEYALDLISDGAEFLIINAEDTGMDEEKILVEVVKTLSQMVQVPLCIETKSSEALDKALRIYPGRALVLTDEKTPDKLLPVASKYGAVCL
jgi:5-methyltetrahydrofolate--homocysteine methyltransferase